MTDGPTIRELDDATVDRIAAGEVVERPASAVKELVENAIDADADRVEVTVRAGGKEGIRVRDDGVGMSEEEARLAVREHTTSKIRDIEDLESGVRTLGFRGEALHAIGAVSRLTLRTRPRGESRGTELVVDGGEIESVEPVGCPEGTTVEVADLFGNVPARRKYLKTDATEFAHVQEVVAGYALAEPDVAVTLRHGDRETFSTPGDGDLRSAVLAVYGREVATNMVEVRADHDPGGPLDSVRGLISHPETNRAGREYVTAFVNGRYVRADAVREAAVDAYGTQLAPDRYPFTVLRCDVPAGTVDVNVHPRKMEVRFADDEGVRAQVRDAVENALLDAGLLRSSAPRGRSQAEQTEIAPERSERENDGNATGETERAPETGVAGAGDGDTERDPPSWTPPETDDGESAPERDDPHRKFRERPAQATFEGETTDEHREFDTLPPMRVLGQVHDTYLVCETDDGLLLVDQHAADERVRYERLRERFLTGDPDSQTLAAPVEFELTAREASVLEDAREPLARVGFRLRRSGDRRAEVTAVPPLLADDPELARDLLSTVGEDPERTVEAAVDALLGDMACKPAIKGNESLSEGTAVDLLAALDACENPYACPHGRPVLVEVSGEELDARFERDYPGHR